MDDAIHAAAAHVLRNAPVGLAACDAGGKVLWANPALGALLGVAESTLLGLPADELIGERSEVIDEHTRRGIINREGSPRRWVELRTTPLTGDDGPSLLFTFTDISAFENRVTARAAVAAGIEASRVDSDTGLLNRRATLQEVNAQVSRSRRYGNPLSLLRMHLEGAFTTDALLRRSLARHLRESLRWVDTAGVMAADELLVVLPETELAAARHVAEKLTARLREDADCAEAAEGIAVAGWQQPEDVNTLLGRLRPLANA